MANARQLNDSELGKMSGGTDLHYLQPESPVPPETKPTSISGSSSGSGGGVGASNLQPEGSQGQ